MKLGVLAALVLVGFTASPAQQVLPPKESGITVREFNERLLSTFLSTSGRPPRVVLTTSEEPGEAKATAVVNLAIVSAQLGNRVLVVDPSTAPGCICNR